MNKEPDEVRSLLCHSLQCVALHTKQSHFLSDNSPDLNRNHVMTTFLEALKASGKLKKIHHIFIFLITGTAVTSPRCYLLIALRVVAKGKQLPKVSSQSKYNPYSGYVSSPIFATQTSTMLISEWFNPLKYEVHLNLKIEKFIS